MEIMLRRVNGERITWKARYMFWKCFASNKVSFKNDWLISKQEWWEGERKSLLFFPIWQQSWGLSKQKPGRTQGISTWTIWIAFQQGAGSGMKQLKAESALTWEVGILRFGGTHCTRIASLLKNKQITFEFQLSMKFLKYFHKRVEFSNCVPQICMD